MQWKMGKIISLKQKSDGIIRSVELETTNGNITRPITKLYPLEVQKDIYENIDTPTRTKRKAAIEAIKKRKK